MKTLTRDVDHDPLSAEGCGSQGLEKAMAGHPFLQGLSPHQARLLKDCAMFTMFEPGELVFGQGDPANRFYLILRGEVALESRAVDGRVTPIDIVAGGEVLGWSWLLPPYLWHFDARAVQRTEAVFLYGTPLREQCEIDHDLGYELFKRISTVMLERLQATRKKLGQ
jgi:CRP/FNR family transcriptional regulator, cyclic AMP receptor protein